MDRIFEKGAVLSPPPPPVSPSAGYPVGGDPSIGLPATKPGPYWYHMITEELLAVINAAGITPDHTDTGQLLEAIVKRGIQSSHYNSATASGTANAITASFSPAITSLVNGLRVYVRAASANSTATPTFQADGTAAKTIVKGADEALLAGDIKGAGHWLEMQYDSTLGKWVLQNPAIGVGITQSFGAAGWQKLSSGLIIQWGRASIVSGQAAADITFPIAFPISCRNISLADNATSSVAIQSQGVDLVTNTGFRVWSSNTNGDQPYWLAIGH